MRDVQQVVGLMLPGLRNPPKLFARHAVPPASAVDVLAAPKAHGARNASAP